MESYRYESVKLANRLTLKAGDTIHFRGTYLNIKYDFIGHVQAILPGQVVLVRHDYDPEGHYHIFDPNILGQFLKMGMIEIKKVQSYRQLQKVVTGLWAILSLQKTTS